MPRGVYERKLEKPSPAMRAAIAYLKQWERKRTGKLTALDLLVMLALKTLIGEL